MAFFSSGEELDHYIGGIFRVAGDNPDVGEKLKSAGITMGVEYSDPECVVTVGFQDPMVVDYGATELAPDITLIMSGDIADKFWRGADVVIDAVGHESALATACRVVASGGTISIPGVCISKTASNSPSETCGYVAFRSSPASPTSSITWTKSLP